MKYILNSVLFIFLAISVYAESSEGIIVFTQEGCSRCEFTINYLKEHKIHYTEYSTDIEENNSKMWSVIEKSGNSEVEHITMPVIVNNGEVFFSIKNLEEFVKKIASK